MAAEEIVTDQTVSLVHQRAGNARGWVDERANNVQQELARVSVDLTLLLKPRLSSFFGCFISHPSRKVKR